MIKICRWLLPLFLGCAAHGEAASQKKATPLPDLGKQWFQELQNPQTRIAALYQLRKQQVSKDRLETLEEFTAEHQRVFVFPCPQPNLPSAWAVITLIDWDAANINLYGPEPKDYPPHPLEIARQKQWKSDFTSSNPYFKIWTPRQPWIESMQGFLVDPSGQQLDSGFFANPGVLIDFDQDGMLDLLEVERIHLEKPKAVCDRVSIGSLAQSQSRKVELYCNRRKSMHEAPRKWKFAVRVDKKASPQLILVDHPSAKKEIAFQFHDTQFTSTNASLPDDILINSKPRGTGWTASKEFLKTHNLTLQGIGSDNACEIEAYRPSPPLFGDFKGLKCKIPDVKNHSPRKAALAIAQAQFSPYSTQQYELASIGKPVTLPKNGWLERWYDGSGWSDASITVWWLEGDKASQWKQKDSKTFLVTSILATPLARRIAITHELDLIRSIPKHPFAPRDDHKSIGGADIPTYRIRVMSTSPSLHISEFQESSPYLWQWVGSRYDRELSALIATTFVGFASETGEPQSIRKLAKIWLDPAKASQTPPALCRTAIQSIQKNHWTEMAPLLTKLLQSLGPATADEKRLIELTNYLKQHQSDQYLYSKKKSQIEVQQKFHSFQNEQQKLIHNLTGSLGYELRSSIQNALTNLKKSKNVKAPRP